MTDKASAAEDSGGWHYGPTDEDPDPGKMWHFDCGGEVETFDGVYICDCGTEWDI